MRQRRGSTGSVLLRNRLALQRFACREFGYEDLGEMLESLARAPGEMGAAGGESEYFRALYLAPAAWVKVTRDRFAEYDANIGALSRRLRMTGEHGRTWKPHQYLALLFTEHYLHRYFDDAEALRADLNRAKSHHRPISRLPDYQPDDLRTLAFQSATGSGKTLLMHAHILQYRHYLSRAGGRLNNVVLVTPNEQMSAQHERELRASGLAARVFSSAAGSDLFAPVEIIDLNKLAEKKGVKRVAVRDFGDDNLVLVDEGHLGATGKVWRERRRELSRGGFTFEYSATFNQVATGKDPDLLHAYGKCLLFDYPYRRFHEDGYGKDYDILNLPGGVQDGNADMYLLGCLLTFYQQLRIWRDHGARWRAFHPAKPLWVFLGKTVTGSSKADRATRSDVVRILRFLGWVLARGETVRPMITRLLDGQSGLLDDEGRDFFHDRFPHLPRTGEDPSAQVYADLCETLFHGAGRLHVVYLTAGEGELHLRTADHDPFGVVNVGDSAALYKLLTEDPDPNADFDVDREMGFAQRLFAGVDRPDSTVNVVIGARRFIAGWSSWRVSTMGLMHVGVGEGPEIIQMFGRGVRLKGWNMSLKRHRESGAPPPDDGARLSELEKLYIFGLRADYMQTFRDLLQQEGIGTERETFTLPTTWNFARKTDLKLIRLKEDRKYELSGERPILPAPAATATGAATTGGAAGLPPVTLDLYSRLQSVASAGAPGAAAVAHGKQEGDAARGNAPAPHGSAGDPAGAGFAQPRPGQPDSDQSVPTPTQPGSSAIVSRGRVRDAGAHGPTHPTQPGSSAIVSREEKAVAEAGAAPDRFSLATHAPFLDAARLHERLLRRKRQRGWHNLVIERDAVDRLLRNDDWYDLRLPPERLNPAGFRQLRGLEDVALDLVTEYADRFWRRERRRWEHDRIEITTLDEDDPNHVRAWKLSMDAAGDKLAEDARALADALREGRFEDLKSWYESLKFGLIRNEAHAYRPLLHVGQDRAVTVQPVPLDENEKRVVDHLESLAGLRHAWLQGRELYLIRNLTRGRGVSFFDDFGYYPDFIVWLKDDARQHVLFLDPKGLSRFGGRERRKVALHHEIGKIEDRLRKDDPNLSLRAYVLSVTPAARIDDGLRSASEWKRDGVYFLDEPDWLRQVIEHALGPEARAA